MFWQKIKLVLGLTLGLGLALVLPTGVGYVQAQLKPPDSVSPPAAEPQGEYRELHGKIIQQKDVPLKESGTTNKFVLLETREGQRIAVDLGPTDALKTFALGAGSEATIKGDMIQVGDNPVFLASQLDVGGHSFDVTRPLTQRLPRERREFEFSGTIENSQGVDVHGGVQHKVVLIKTDRGRRILVDLGPMDKLQGVDLRKGVSITVKGHANRAGERVILFAERLEVGDQSLQIERAPFQREGPEEGTPGVTGLEPQSPAQAPQMR